MDDINYYLQLGDTIKRLRLKQKMTKTQLAEGICSISYITRIENGERCPNSVILRQLTNKLGTDPDYFFRSIESPTSINLKDLIDKLLSLIERNDFTSIYNLTNSLNKKQLETVSLRDFQLINGMKCISTTVMTKSYQLGLNKITNILTTSYKKDSLPTDVEFALMYNKGLFLLLNNQKEEAYNHLIKMKNYSQDIKFLNNKRIFPKYCVYLISACLDTLNFKEAFLYLDYAINYCKQHNVLPLLRELYFLKSEIFYCTGNDKEFEIWFNKSLSLHKLIKNTDSEYFNTFANNRLNKVKTS